MSRCPHPRGFRCCKSSQFPSTLPPEHSPLLRGIVRSCCRRLRRRARSFIQLLQEVLGGSLAGDLVAVVGLLVLLPPLSSGATTPVHFCRPRGIAGLEAQA